MSYVDEVLERVKQKMRLNRNSFRLLMKYWNL